MPGAPPAPRLPIGEGFFDPRALLPCGACGGQAFSLRAFGLLKSSLAKDPAMPREEALEKQLLLLVLLAHTLM